MIVFRFFQASGKYSKAKAKEIHQLLHDGLYINVATEAYETSELRGKISLLPYSTSLANYKGWSIVYFDNQRQYTATQ